MSDLHELTATEQRAALGRREISSRDLTEHYLERIDRFDPELGAFVEITEKLALQEADSADRRLAAGEDSPLLGLPLAYKDLSAVAGVRITLGSRAFSAVPTSDGPVVGLLREAGAVTLGTTHAPELGPTCWTHSDVVGRPAVTPYDLTRYASGSSGGAAAAVAAGLLPFAHGSDGAGSLRTPAAVCGLVGIKPSRGRLPGTSGFISWGTEGPLARTVADAALLLDVMSVPSPGDLYGLPTGNSYAEATQTDPPQLRVLMYDDSGLDQLHPACARALTRTATLLQDLGHEVISGCNPVPWTEELIEHLLVVVTGSVAVAAGRLGDPELLQPYTRWCLEEGRSRSAVDFAAAQSALAAAACEVLARTAVYDVVLSPVTSSPAVPVGWFEQDGQGRECGRRMLGWSAYTPWANFTGQPALSLPLHVTEDGLPVGVQLTAARGADHLLLAVSAQVERATPFAHRHPPQW